MEEEKKNNKGIIVGIIRFLVLCLIAIIYFIFKNVYVGPNNTPSELNETETNDTSEEKQVEFTELTKYTLEEGEEKEITVADKKITLKKENNKYYLNNKELYAETSVIYVTNQVILCSPSEGQFGAIYYAYDLNGNKIDIESEDAQFSNLRIESGKLMVDAFIMKTHWMEGYRIGNLRTVPEGMGDCSKKLSDYPEIIEEHKNEILDADYYFDYVDNKLILKELQVKLTVEELAKDASNVCVEENN